jgi:hypothetical protein
MEEDHVANFTDMSVSQWVSIHQQISRRVPNDNEPLPEFQAIEWALTGRDTVGQRSARLDALRNRPPVQSPDPTIRRDYDSVLGFTRDIVANGAIFLYIRPSPIRAITKNLKLETTFMINGQVSNMSLNVLGVSHHHMHPCCLLECIRLGWILRTL